MPAASKTKKPTPPSAQNLTPNQVAKRLGVSRATVQNWMDRKLIECFSLPRSPGAKRIPRRIPLAAVERIESEARK